ncbi:MAG TPA: phosphoribosylamine--glycine ligase [Candidatus Limnocylindrales bacterium]
MSRRDAGPARVLVVGSGGREHALAWRLARERAVEQVLVAPGSDGIAAEPRIACLPDVGPEDAPALVALAREAAVDLVVIGPEAPLAAGIADALLAADLPVFGPSAAAARIETSKAFCREVAAAAGVPIARGAAFRDPAAATALARELDAAPGSSGVVVKADGLAGGKGVTVCDDAATAEAAIARLFADPGTGGTTVVVEERLSGPEASLIALCDGHTALALPPARDHKRLADGDRGPNTGGMGAYSPVPDVPESAAAALIETVHRPILAELAARGTPFRGALYAGLILTQRGPVLLECNARFGDPEAQVLLPRLALPLAPLLLAAARGELAAAAAELGLQGASLPVTDDAAVAIVLASAGYPAAPRAGDAIRGLDRLPAGALIFHAGSRRDPDGVYRTAGGRVLAVVGLGSDLAAARRRAERAADAIAFEGLQRRHDIAADLPAASGASATPRGAASGTAGGTR